MERWKCLVCDNITEAEEKPSKCPYCHSDPHKIKQLWKKVKGWSTFID